MKKLVVALIAAASLVVVGSAAADPLRYGVADDWPKFNPCGDVWWQAAGDIGYQDLRMTVQWDGSTAIPFQSNIQAAVDCALLNNVQPILAVYPAKPALIGSNASAQAAFATFVGLVAQTFPSVDDFIVGNEPNVNRFWQPQYVNGHDAAGADYEHTLAQAYDDVKLVRPDANVWGPAISSRGNDNAKAASNPSHSPVWFIHDMGVAYRASGRTKPIFDEFDMHPYPPVQDTDPYSKPFQWPQAGAANLDRIKQALWDAFHDTAQPTPTEQPGGRVTQSARFTTPQALPLNLDEVGSQTMVTGHESAYTDPPESIHPISEATQAQYYTQLMEIAACDPDVASLLFFPLIDEPDLNQGFQSGDLFADLAHKQSYDAIKQKIASSAGLCQGGVPGISKAWQHTTQVVGAEALFGGPKAGAHGVPARHTGVSTRWTFSATAGEDATYTAGIYKVTGGRRSATPALSTTGHLKAYRKPIVRLPAKRLSPGRYAYGIKLTAAVNPARTTTFFSKTFSIGS